MLNTQKIKIRKKFYSLLMVIFIISLLLPNNVFAETSSSMKVVSYYSSTVKETHSAYVYLPAGYSTSEKYPVLYLLHGGGGDHNQWVTGGGNSKNILDSAISSGKAKKMIVVIPDCAGKVEDPATFTKNLMNDIIPYFEKTYSINTDKDSRAIAGLSWGGLQTLDAALYNYTKFGYVGVFSSGWFTSDTAKYNTMRSYLSANGTKIQSNFNFFYYGDGGSSEIAYQNGLATMKLLKECGISTKYYQHSGGHSFQCWNADLQDFIPNIFNKVTTTAPPTTSSPTSTPTMPPIKYGDVNNDGLITSTDVSMVERYVLGSITLSSTAMRNADVNVDSRINSTDASFIGRYILGMVPSLPVYIQN